MTWNISFSLVTGVLLGRFLPQVPAFLNRFEYARVSVPMAILIWLMIYPMMMKVDFQSIKNVGKNPKGLWRACGTNTEGRKGAVMVRRQRKSPKSNE